MGLTLVLAPIGMLIGAFAEHGLPGAMLGATTGTLVASLLGQHRRLALLEDEVARLSSAVARLRAVLEQPHTADVAAQATVAGQAATVRSADVEAPRVEAAEAAREATARQEPSAAEPDATAGFSAAVLPPLIADSGPPDPSASALAAARSALLGANTVVRVGVIIVIIGVGLLGKWAAEHDYFPPEARLMLATAMGIAMVGVGWRLRLRRAGYAMTLQGGGVGVIYVTAFMALRLYGLIPAAVAFLLFAALAVFSHALAVLQDAKPLAVLGTVGGFLAPIMASTGAGNHVVLFSFYALLNLGILAVAWLKAWRLLNLVGFFFTFGVSGFWVATRYHPELFWTTEPFLVLHWLIYLTIPVLFARRQPPRLRGWVDGTIVFGAAPVVFALQSGVIETHRFGLAWSAFGMAAVYIGTATGLLALAPRTMRSMVEAFIAMGVAFGTVAIPLAVDDHRITGAAWALEGAGLVWIGIRQGRLLPRVCGCLLQPAAAVAFAAAAGSGALLPVVNGRFLGCLMLAFAALFIAWYLQRHRKHIHDAWVALGHALLVWGIGWWLGGAVREVERLLPWTYDINGVLLLMLFTAAGLEVAGKRLQWPAARRAALCYLPVAYGFLPLVAHEYDHPFARYGVAPWCAGIATYYLLLWRQETTLGPRLVAALHAGILWLATAVAAWELGWLIDQLASGAQAWRLCVWLLAPTAALALLLVLQRREAGWPVGRWRAQYLSLAAPVLGLSLAAGSMLLSLSNDGAAHPLPYQPLVNPVDLAQGLSLLALGAWVAVARQQRVTLALGHSGRAVIWGVSLVGFVWLNAMLARSVHHFADVPFTRRALSDSVVMQTALSIFWTTLALTAMVVGTRARLRTVWIAAACLMAVVVLKLFVIDLSRLSAVAKIVSFLVVGGLLLLTGYFSPVPPMRAEEATRDIASSPRAQTDASE